MYIPISKKVLKGATVLLLIATPISCGISMEISTYKKNNYRRKGFYKTFLLDLTSSGNFDSVLFQTGLTNTTLNS